MLPFNASVKSFWDLAMCLCHFERDFLIYISSNELQSLHYFCSQSSSASEKCLNNQAANLPFDNYRQDALDPQLLGCGRSAVHSRCLWLY